MSTGRSTFGAVWNGIAALDGGTVKWPAPSPCKYWSCHSAVRLPFDLSHWVSEVWRVIWHEVEADPCPAASQGFVMAENVGAVCWTGPFGSMATRSALPSPLASRTR